MGRPKGKTTTPEGMREYQRQWRAKNKDKVRAYYLAYAKTHKKERAEYFAKWYEKNRKKVAARRKVRKVAQ